MCLLQVSGSPAQVAAVLQFFSLSQTSLAESFIRPKRSNSVLSLRSLAKASEHVPGDPGLKLVGRWVGRCCAAGRLEGTGGCLWAGLQVGATSQLDPLLTVGQQAVQHCKQYKQAVQHCCSYSCQALPTLLSCHNSLHC